MADRDAATLVQLALTEMIARGAEGPRSRVFSEHVATAVA